MGHGLKDVQKHITPWAVVITSLLVRDKPIGAPASVKRVYLQNILIHESISRAAHKRLPHGVCCICVNLCIQNHQFVSLYCQMRHSYFCTMAASFGEKFWLYFHNPIVLEEPFHKYCPLTPVHVFDSLSWNGQRRYYWSHKSWWRHQMETFSALLAICAGNSPVPVNSPHKDQWRGALMFSLISVWINDWVNNREAGDLRCYRSHYDVTVMIPYYLIVYLKSLTRQLWAFQ